MLTPTGFVTDAYLVVNMLNHWSSYYKWLQQGRWSWLALARQFVWLILSVIKSDVVHLVIDDTLTLRASKKAPGMLNSVKLSPANSVQPLATRITHKSRLV